MRFRKDIGPAVSGCWIEFRQYPKDGLVEFNLFRDPHWIKGLHPSLDNLSLILGNVVATSIYKPLPGFITSIWERAQRSGWGRRNRNSYCCCCGGSCRCGVPLLCCSSLSFVGGVAFLFLVVAGGAADAFLFLVVAGGAVDAFLFLLTAGVDSSVVVIGRVLVVGEFGLVLFGQVAWLLLVGSQWEVVVVICPHTCHPATYTPRHHHYHCPLHSRSAAIPLQQKAYRQRCAISLLE
jgi:hypothetical protein